MTMPRAKADGEKPGAGRPVICSSTASDSISQKGPAKRPEMVTNTRKPATAKPPTTITRRIPLTQLIHSGRWAATQASAGSASAITPQMTAATTSRVISAGATTQTSSRGWARRYLPPRATSPAPRNS